MFSKLLTIRLFGQCLYPIIVYVSDYSFHPGISDVKPPPPVPICDWADPPVASLMQHLVSRLVSRWLARRYRNSVDFVFLLFPRNIRSKFRSPLAASSVDASSFLALLGFLHLLLQLGDVLLILSHLLLVVGGCGNVFGCRTAMPLFYTHRRYVMRSMIIITLHMVNGSLTQRNPHYYPWKEHPLLLQLTSSLLLIPLCAVNNFAIAVAGPLAQWTISLSRLR